MSTKPQLFRVGRLHLAERIGTSVNGNPRFRLVIAELDRDTIPGPCATFVTQSDAACSYDVQNIARKIRDADGVLVAFRTTRAGRVWDLRDKWEV